MTTKKNIRVDPYQLFLDSITNESPKRNYGKQLYHFLKLIPDEIYYENLEKIPQLEREAVEQIKEDLRIEKWSTES